MTFKMRSTLKFSTFPINMCAKAHLATISCSKVKVGDGGSYETAYVYKDLNDSQNMFKGSRLVNLLYYWVWFESTKFGCIWVS